MDVLGERSSLTWRLCKPQAASAPLERAAVGGGVLLRQLSWGRFLSFRFNQLLRLLEFVFVSSRFLALRLSTPSRLGCDYVEKLRSVYAMTWSCTEDILGNGGAFPWTLHTRWSRLPRNVQIIAAAAAACTPVCFSNTLIPLGSIFISSLQRKPSVVFLVPLAPFLLSFLFAGAKENAGTTRRGWGGAGRELFERLQARGVLPEVQDRVPYQRHGVLPYRRQGI